MEKETEGTSGRRERDAQQRKSGHEVGRPRTIKRPQLLSICVAQLNEGIQITMPYTVAVYMVRDFESQKHGKDADERTIGRLTGILAASFCAAQFISSFPWGRISDKHGRKPMLVMSNLSSCLSVIGFGLSDSFLMAVMFRLAGGFFNCTFVCLKSMIGESCDADGQARPLSILSLCWGLGTIVGPSLGGVLSQPCETFGQGFPFCKPGQFFQRRPFILPTGVVGSISFLALLSSVFFLEETLPRKVARKYAAVALEEDDLFSEARTRARYSLESELANLSERDSLWPKSRSSQSEDEEAGILEVHAPGSQVEDGPEDERREAARDFLKRNDTASQMGGGMKEGDKNAQKNWEGKGTGSQEIESEDTRQPEREEQSLEQEAAVWYTDRQVLLTVSGYTMLCLLYNLMDEVTPIYGSAARTKGGLGLSTSQLALPIALSGVAIFVWSMLFYPWLQSLLGVLRTCQLGLAFTIPLCFGIALPSLLPVGTLPLQLMLAGVLCAKSIMATNSFTSSVIMVNTAAPQKSMGSVNGASQAAASFVRAVGPALGGLMWGYSVSVPISGHQLLPFAVTAVCFVVPLLLYSNVSLPKSPQRQPEAGH